MKRRLCCNQTLLFLLSFMLMAAPVIMDTLPQAEARAGHGSSIGSRGSRTYSPPSFTQSAPRGAQSFQRSMTTPSPINNPRPTSPYASPNMTPRPPMPSYQTSTASGSFFRGIAGGFLGATAYNMLFGHKAGNAETNGTVNTTPQNGSSSMGMLFRLIIFVLIIWFVVRLFRRNRNNNAINSPISQNFPQSSNSMNNSSSQSPTQLTNEDYKAFQERLMQIQDAWSRQDLNGLQKLTTPEMLSYFHEQLTDLASKGLHNATSDVRFEQGDLAESWSEGNREYATVSMRYSLIDVTTDNAGRVVEGNPSERTIVTEFWTFIRASNTNWWLLSGIQQEQ